MARYTVLVTGGNGCLGQHIVRLLQEKADFVTHIKVLDLRKFSNQLNYRGRKPVEAFVGDVIDEEVIKSATSGVDCVIHVASVVDVRMFPNEANLYKVNVTGTEKLLQVCIRQNVRGFVYCSSQTAVMGYEEIIDSDETLVIPKKFLFGPYGVTKHLAEQVVESQNGASLPDGGRMQTLSLRPVTMYGELDCHWVPNFLHWANLLGGTMVPFANGTTQAAYAGNVAWGFVCAVKAVRENSDLGGETFFMCDDTPMANMFELVDPFLKSCGFKLIPFTSPYWLTYLAAVLFICIAWIVSPIFEINSNFTPASARFMNMRVNSVYSKATKMLNYTPLYSHEESLRRSIQYYKQPTIW
ncbi:3 beta-hydroxysteroid dehydrogenase/Delta 5--_4-isomerase-like [Pecten maximus]|uniref:3 beta-hydroxysteroid dehydrogenase/Delta 5-->4-isomerase-like n=1 Tax=Pecten maximus TaxID=6579 RepID=UPI001457FB8F|nr:3 beta-hydroxysteroid dehydrogenase/Delta 5-->4-isomerase-like [Pecten maximus]